jgi:hypothetical protein
LFKANWLGGQVAFSILKNGKVYFGFIADWSSGLVDLEKWKS